MSELLRLKDQLTTVAENAGSMSVALDGLRKKLESVAEESQRQIRGTSQQARYAEMISSYENAAKACVAASTALTQASRLGKEIGEHL